MPGAGARLAVGGKQLRHRSARHWDGHDPIARRPGPLERLSRGQRGDEERGTRALCRAGQGGDVAEAVKAALGGDALLFQKAAHLLHTLFKPGAAFIEPNAEAGELMGQEGAGEADIKAAVAQRVRHRDLAGELQWVVERRQHRPGDKPGMARALRGGGEEQEGVGAVAAVGVKVVLDRADMAVAILVAQVDQPQRLLPVVAA